jgi:cytochrome c553
MRNLIATTVAFLSMSVSAQSHMLDGPIHLQEWSVFNEDFRVASVDDRFADIRGKWVQCAACHGPQGQGGIGPTLAGQSADDIINKLMAYKRGETVGAQSMMMWPQAKGLTDGQIGMIGVFVQEGFPES